MNRVIGSKYQTFIDDDFKVFRLLNIKTAKDNTERFIVTDGDIKISMTEEEISKCVLLEPDGFLNFIATDTGVDEEDVYICLNKSEDLSKNTKEPAVIVRQNVLNQINNFVPGNDIWVGDAFNYMDIDKEEYMTYMDFANIEHTYSIAVYVDDKLEDIVKVLGHKSKKFNDTLLNIKKIYPESIGIKGLNDTVEQLLKNTSFMYHFRRVFGINCIDFPIDLGDNKNEDGDILLNEKQVKMLCDFLRADITNIITIKYDKDIDVSKIVDHTHVMVSDSNDEIYLIAYTVINPYPVDDDIRRAMLK